jgi:hypothetical protein
VAAAIFDVAKGCRVLPTMKLPWNPLPSSSYSRLKFDKFSPVAVSRFKGTACNLLMLQEWWKISNNGIFESNSWYKKLQVHGCHQKACLYGKYELFPNSCQINNQVH